MRSVLRDVYDTADPSVEAERRFFSRVRLPSGVLKTTEARRLDDVNELAARLLPDTRPLELMDVATSTGITTLEWSEQLAAAGIAHHLVAGDSHVEGVRLSLPGIGEVLFDRELRGPLYAELFGRAIDVSGGSMRSAGAVRTLKTAARLSGLLGLPARTVDLVSPRLRRSPAITVVEDDIFVRRPELDGRFHAVRAANILNRVYFEDGQLASAVANLRWRLRPDGILIVCRTHDDGSNHGSYLRAAGDAWHVVGRVGEGSEVESLLRTI